jgi:hypothetical protein
MGAGSDRRDRTVLGGARQREDRGLEVRMAEFKLRACIRIDGLTEAEISDVMNADSPRHLTRDALSVSAQPHAQGLQAKASSDWACRIVLEAR